MRKTNEMKKNNEIYGASIARARHRRLDQENGITLIALIITIIVMLILVSVTISMAINGGLFEKAGEAVGEMQNAIDVEQQLANGEIKIGDIWYNSIDDYLAGIESVRSLQEKHEFTYYSSLAKAVEAVNTDKIEDNADAEKETAVAGVYTENEKHFVVLLKDTIEQTRVKPAVDMTINLGGCSLSTEDVVGIDCLSGELTIDGRIGKSKIEVSHTGGKAARPIQVKPGSKLNISGGTYYAHSEGYTGVAACIYLNDNVIANISNASILATETTGISEGIKIDAVYGEVETMATVTNCDVRAYTNHGNGSFSLGIEFENAILTLNNSNVMGTLTGISSSGTLYVNGGTYEGFAHGGFYFGGEGTTSYVRNAKIRQCQMPEGYTSTSESENIGFSIRKISIGKNIKVYMDNCDIYGSSKPILINSSSGEQNNTLYISNSRINTDKKIDIGNNTHKLFIGKGCNFTAENTTLPEAVTITDEVYIK